MRKSSGGVFADGNWILYIIKASVNYIPLMTQALVVWLANRTSVYRKVVKYAKYYY